MKKQNSGWFFFRFKIYQKISKITNFQNSLEKLHRVLWFWKTMHSKGFLPLLNLKIEKKDISPFSAHQIHRWLWYNMAVSGLKWAHMSPKTAILYLNHGRIWWVENGETSFFPFCNWAMGKNFSNILFYSIRGHDAASLKSFENWWFLKFFDKF